MMLLIERLVRYCAVIVNNDSYLEDTCHESYVQIIDSFVILYQLGNVKIVSWFSFPLDPFVIIEHILISLKYGKEVSFTLVDMLYITPKVY